MQTIQQQIIEEIADYLKPYKDEYTKQHFEFKITDFWLSDNIYQVEINGYHKDNYDTEQQTAFLLLRFFTNFEYRQVQISNIFLSDFLRYQGLGKKLIYVIFTISKEEHYDLFIVDMVNSFYHRMIKRGALPCDDCDDAVQIVSNTELI